jgi:hypothetical protein
MGRSFQLAFAGLGNPTLLSLFAVTFQWVKGLFETMRSCATAKSSLTPSLYPGLKFFHLTTTRQVVIQWVVEFVSVQDLFQIARRTPVLGVPSSSFGQTLPSFEVTTWHSKSTFQMASSSRSGNVTSHFVFH